MNRCIISGKIMSEIEYKFIIKNKDNSVAKFYIELDNKNIVKIISYNEIADKVLRKLKEGDGILIEGYLIENGEIVLLQFERMQQ